MSAVKSTLLKYSCHSMLVFFLALLGAALAAPVQKPATTTLILKMAKGLTLAQAQSVAKGHGGTPKGSIPKLDLHIIEVPTQAADNIIKAMKGDAQILRVESDHVRKWQGAPSDTQYSNQWALPKISWDLVYGVANPNYYTKVAILDTGVDTTHPDLTGVVVPGWSVFDTSDGTTDENGHGTWLAGIVAARTDNLQGIAGVGYDHVQVMPVKVLDPSGLGQDSDIIQGIMWATDNGASVILMAFSATGYSLALQDAIDYAWVHNVVLVAAAGNEASNTPTFPAGDRGVIGVSATDQNDILAPSSTIGGSVFLAAPGVDILGTYPNNSYVTWSGTSASAAIVAGTAALMRAVDPSLSNGVVVNRIALTADVAGTPEQTGNGRVNVSRAINETSTDALQPAGAAPFGNGGPFVGPYRIAAKTLTLAFSGNGSGSVTSTGAPLPQFSCTDTAGVASGTCSANLNNNDLVNFTATAASGSSIGTWTLSQVTIQSGCTSGSTTCNVKMGNAAATVTLSINPLPTKLAFTTLVFSIAVGQCSGTVTVQSQTASNVASNVTSTTTVHLSRNSGNGAFYSDAACSTALVGDNVTIANGTSSANFFFKDTIAGGPTITAHQTAGTPALTDATQTETINKASTSTAVTSNPNPSTTGELVTFTAIISVTAPGAGSPSGIVNFTDGGTTITGCGTQPVSANQATCTTALLSITSHTIAAAYSGDINFNGSTSGNLTQVVNPAPFFKAVISPTTDVVNHSTAAYSITVTDCNNAACPTQGNVNDTIIVVNIDIPADYSGVAVTTVSSTGHTWDSVVASGQIQLTAHSSTDKLSPGEAVTVNFTATTPSTLAADPTSEPWNAHAFGGQNNTKPFTISTNGQPAVSVSRCSTSTAVTFAANPITYGQNTTATITVTDTEATGTKSNPGVGDTVSVISDSSDTITGTCTLAAVPATTDRSSCQVTITPTHASVHRISATFTATTVHKTSNGSSGLTVDKKTLTASIVNDPTKTYNGNTDATLIPSNFSLSGLVGSETFTMARLPARTTPRTCQQRTRSLHRRILVAWRLKSSFF